MRREREGGKKEVIELRSKHPCKTGRMGVIVASHDRLVTEFRRLMAEVSVVCCCISAGLVLISNPYRPCLLPFPTAKDIYLSLETFVAHLIGLRNCSRGSQISHRCPSSGGVSLLCICWPSPLYIQVIEGCYDALAGMRARSRPMSELVLGILTMVRSIPRHETLRPEMRTTNPACDAGDDLLPAGKTMHKIAQSQKVSLFT